MNPAMAEWQKELREGKRKPTTLDDLWRAACEAVIGTHCLTRDAVMRSEREANRLLVAYHKTKKRERSDATRTRDGFKEL